jgi:1,4-alpha-glucan branching enzyme
LGLLRNGILKIKEGKQIVDTYVWQHDDTGLPNNHEIVIYEMHVADFTGGEDDPHKRENMWMPYLWGNV